MYCAIIKKAVLEMMEQHKALKTNIKVETSSYKLGTYNFVNFVLSFDIKNSGYRYCYFFKFDCELLKVTEINTYNIENLRISNYGGVSMGYDWSIIDYVNEALEKAFH